MDLTKIEKKWQKIWKDKKCHIFTSDEKREKYYVLEMFSYPSGSKLHVGHWYNYGPSDTFARFKRMQGYNVFQPMGFDAFGLPAENYAIKTGIHPKDSTLQNIKTMEGQLAAIGAMFDTSATLSTCMPDYYRWTQWLFLKLYEKGLAYRKQAPVNWCPSCHTVLANEQVLSGECERCSSAVAKKNLTQWFFKITDYSEELLQDLNKLDWPEKTLLMQKNWIGKSVGAEIEFSVDNGKGQAFNVFTTRADTLLGVSYVVLAPEHELTMQLIDERQRAFAEEYIRETAKVSEIDRLSGTREKTGVFTGSYAINPANQKKIPIYIADYVLATYGTGAVMGVPAHDERDYEFAKKYGLEIKRVINGDKGQDDSLPYTGEGTLTGSGEFDGLTCDAAKGAIVDKLSQAGKGSRKVNYRLRDWLVSRQRYWGAPIPVVHCETCGIVPVPEKDLPVELPYNVDFAPDGKSPLAKSEEFINTSCPSCGKAAKRDADTLDTFVCSSWYFLRYADSLNAEKAFDSGKINKMLPVDKYIGGAEHACMHLLYARFITKALRDMGYIDFGEPFTSLVHQGLILGPDGNKMSKSRGNVISPDDYVQKLGADVFRLYLMFGFSYTEGGAWSDDGIKAIVRFTERVEKIVLKAYEGGGGTSAVLNERERELDYARNYAIKHCTANIEVFSFNTAIARLMEFTNAMYKYDGETIKNHGFFKDCARDLILLIAPFAPHFAEELWELCGNGFSVFDHKYPPVNEQALQKSRIELAVQINSKVRGKVVVDADEAQERIQEAAMAVPQIQDQLQGKAIKKVIYIADKLINFVV